MASVTAMAIPHSFPSVSLCFLCVSSLTIKLLNSTLQSLCPVFGSPQRPSQNNMAEMDPADTNNLRQALGQPRHPRWPTTTHSPRCCPSASIRMEPRLTSLLSLHPLSRQPHSASPLQLPQQPTAQQPYIPPPERYLGDLGICRTFLFQCSLVFAQQPLTYSTDQTKVAYIMGLLKGSALDGATAVRESQSNLNHSFVEFCS